MEWEILALLKELSKNAALTKAIGATYLSSRETPVGKWGEFDAIYEAAGSPRAALEALAVLAANGVLILTGVPGAGDFVNFDAGRFVREVVLRNQLVVGTVNAGKASFAGAIASLRQMNQRWPEALRGLITGRSPLEAYADLLLSKPAGIKNVLVRTFAEVHSLALQQTLYEMGKAILEAYGFIAEIKLSAPNEHHFLYDLGRFGLENDNEVFHADDRPYGLIQATVMRDDAPAAGPAWDASSGLV
jgi:hypothetical protein